MNLWGQGITLRGQIFVSRTGDVTLRVVRLCVCAFVRLCVCVCCWCAMRGSWHVCWCQCLCVTLTSHPQHHTNSSPRVYVQNALTVCTFNTSPFVPAPRPQVLPHAGEVPVHTETFQMYARVFSACHTTPHAHTSTTTTCTTHHGNNAQHHTETGTGRDRQGQR